MSIIVVRGCFVIFELRLDLERFGEYLMFKRPSMGRICHAVSQVSGFKGKMAAYKCPCAFYALAGVLDAPC